MSDQYELIIALFLRDAFLLNIPILMEKLFIIYKHLMECYFRNLASETKYQVYSKSALIITVEKLDRKMNSFNNPQIVILELLHCDFHF